MNEQRPARSATQSDAGGDSQKAPWWQPSLVLFGKLSGWIAGPVLMGVFLGKWLDRKYGTEPWLFLLTVGIAFFISMFGIVKDAMREMKRIEREEKDNRKPPPLKKGDQGGFQKLD